MKAFLATVKGRNAGRGASSCKPTKLQAKERKGDVVNYLAMFACLEAL